MLTRRLRKASEVLAAITAVALSATLCGEVERHQEMWPLPGFYFLEVIVLTGLAAYLAFEESRSATILSWAIGGAILGFSLLGAMSIGLFYLPVVLFILAGAALAQHERPSQYLQGIGIALLAAITQGGMMLLLIRILHPEAIF